MQDNLLHAPIYRLQRHSACPDHLGQQPSRDLRPVTPAPSDRDTPKAPHSRQLHQQAHPYQPVSPAFAPALRYVAYHTSCRPSQRRHPASNSQRRRSHSTWRPTHRFAKHPDPRGRGRHSRCRTVGSRYACHADAWTSSLRAQLCAPVATSGLLGAQCLSGVLLLGAFALVLRS
jgi:hypothetical protein